MLIQFKGIDFTEGGVCAPKGFTASGIHCGIRKNKEKEDLALISCKVPCSAAAIYTQNKVKGAPLAVTKRHLANGTARAVICNSGNANTCNANGEQVAEQMCELAGNALGISADDVIVCSTGVIGMPLPIEPIALHVKPLAASLSTDGSLLAAKAIMTTDTFPKNLSVTFELGGKQCVIGGIAKGSGMIHPNMATMLCFLTTDVCIDSEWLQKALKLVADKTFNMISIDGDTSTNDMCAIMASGLAGNDEIHGEGPDYEMFVNALYALLMNLSRDLARDGEGATKLLECAVDGAPDETTAKKVAKSVITSSLFKAAMFGADANWGRILCAIGYTDAEFHVDEIEVLLSSRKGTIKVCEHGAGVWVDEVRAKEILLEDEIKIIIHLNDGDASAIAWGCDLTYDYVKINGDYRT